MGTITNQELTDLINESETGVETPETQPENTPTPQNEAPQPETAPAAEKTPEALTFNLDEELQKISNGEIKTQDELKAILGKTKELGTLEAKLKNFEDENTSLKAKVATDPFANDLARKLNDMYKSGANQSQVDAFIRINKVENIDALSPVEAKKLELQIKQGLSAEEAEQYVTGTYKLVAEDPNDNDELAKIKLEEIRLKVDANASREFLKTHKAEVSAVPVDNSQIEAQKKQEDFQKHITDLTPLVKNVSNILAFKDINVNGKDGEAAFKMDLELSDESKASLEPALMDYISKNGANIPNTEEGIAHIKTVGENILVLQNWKNWLANATNTREKAVRAEYHNPSTPNRGTDNPNQGKTSKEELADWLLANG